MILSCVKMVISISIKIDVTSSGVVKQQSFLGKSRTVTGTVPAMLRPVPFEAAAHMWASFFGKSHQIYGCFSYIGEKLRVQYASGGRKQFRVLVAGSHNNVGQKHCRGH